MKAVATCRTSLLCNWLKDFLGRGGTMLLDFSLKSAKVKDDR